jgi:hypothetical protein
VANVVLSASPPRNTRRHLLTPPRKDIYIYYYTGYSLSAVGSWRLILYLLPYRWNIKAGHSNVSPIVPRRETSPINHMIRSLWPSLPSLLCLPYSAPSRTPHCWGTFHVIIEPRSLRFSGSVRLFSFVHHWMLFVVVLLLCAEPSIRERATRCRSMRPPPCEEIRGGFSMNAKRGLGCGALPCVSILNLRSQ